MSTTINMLYQREYAINEVIKIIIPTVGEVVDDEDNYYGIVSALTAMPIDLMVQLDDAGIDFTSINEWELFLLLFGGLRDQDTHLIFGDLDLKKFNLEQSPDNGMLILRHSENGAVIDRAIHGRIATTLRTIHHLKKNRRKPGNDEAKEYMIERARKKMKREKNRKEFSQLESLIIAMVNTPEFKYDYTDTRDISIYQFNQSVRQIIHKVDYEHRMSGIYAGTVDVKNLSQDDLNWLVHK